MKKKEVLKIIKEHQRELTEVYGVKSLALFGSVARDEAGPSSDIDMLVEFYPGRIIRAVFTPGSTRGIVWA